MHYDAKKHGLNEANENLPSFFMLNPLMISGVCNTPTGVVDDITTGVTFLELLNPPHFVPFFVLQDKDGNFLCFQRDVSFEKITQEN